VQKKQQQQQIHSMVINSTKQLPRLQSVKPNGNNSSSEAPLKVDISSLHWEEKEQVLHLLFQKMNAGALNNNNNNHNLNNNNNINRMNPPGINSITVAVPSIGITTNGEGKVVPNSQLVNQFNEEENGGEVVEDKDKSSVTTEDRTTL
jgi:hypothetical protein